MFNDGKKDRYWIYSRYITFAHVARLILFVPSEAAIHPPVALQFRSDARRVLAVEFVIEASWNDEWTFEWKINFFSLFFFPLPPPPLNVTIEFCPRRRERTIMEGVSSWYDIIQILSSSTSGTSRSIVSSQSHLTWTKIQLRYKKIFERISHRIRGQVTRKILVLAGWWQVQRESLILVYLHSLLHLPFNHGFNHP